MYKMLTSSECHRLVLKFDCGSPWVFSIIILLLFTFNCNMSNKRFSYFEGFSLNHVSPACLNYIYFTGGCSSSQNPASCHRCEGAQQRQKFHFHMDRPVPSRRQHNDELSGTCSWRSLQGIYTNTCNMKLTVLQINPYGNKVSGQQ